MLILNNVTKSFGGKTVLDNISLRIEENSCCAIIGKNGVGKTTLLNLVYRLLMPDAGDIISYGKPGTGTKELIAINMETGFAAGTGYLVEEFTGFEFLKFVCHAFKITHLVTDDKIANIFNYFFENEKDINKPIAAYSFGMKQKMAICAAIMHKPKILLLDEPFSGLDPFSCNRLITFLKSHLKNRIQVVASHDLSHISKIATHIAILDEQRIIYYDTLDNFTNNGYKEIEQSLFEILKPKDDNIESINFIL